jgi:hypothetical protein
MPGSSGSSPDFANESRTSCSRSPFGVVREDEFALLSQSYDTRGTCAQGPDRRRMPSIYRTRVQRWTQSEAVSVRAAPQSCARHKRGLARLAVRGRPNRQHLPSLASGSSRLSAGRSELLKGKCTTKEWWTGSFRRCAGIDECRHTRSVIVGSVSPTYLVFPAGRGLVWGAPRRCSTRAEPPCVRGSGTTGAVRGVCPLGGARYTRQEGSPSGTAACGSPWMRQIR